MTRRGLTTHVLDTARGCPAVGVRIDFSAIADDGSVRPLTSVLTDGDGRARVVADGQLATGRYELAFHVAAYFRATPVSAGVATGPPAPVGATLPSSRIAAPALPGTPFYDVIPVRFAVADDDSHYHVPLLVSPFSYTTYRGS